MPPKLTTTTTPPTAGNAKGRANRVLQLLDAMTQEERADMFDQIGETYCTNGDCSEVGIELPDEDSKEPDHECDDEDDEEGDEGSPDGDPSDEDDEGDVEDEDNQENSNDE